MPKGTLKSGNTLSKDFASESHFVDSARVQKALDLSNKIMPPGTILGWMEGYFTAPANVGYTTTKSTTYPSLKISKLSENDFYAIADGATCSDPRSLYYGQAIPNLTDDRFLMGQIVGVGLSGGSNSLNDHFHVNNLTATLDMANTYKFNHSHTASGGAATGARLATHYFVVYDYYGASGPSVLDVLCSDDHDDHTGSMPSSTPSVPPTHSHIGSISSTASNINTVSDDVGYSHEHVISMSPASYIGAGSFPSVTDNRPRFLSCVFLFKVL